MHTERLSSEERTTLETYERIAEEWNRKRGDPDFWKRQFEEFSLLVPRGYVLDIGCGGGRDALNFIQHGYTYTGIDLSQAMLEQAKRKVPDAQFMRMNFHQLEFTKKTFDGFWAVTSLLHVPKCKIHATLDEIRRVTRKRAIGCIILKEGEGERYITLPGNDVRFYAFYEREEFVRILDQSGFSLLKFDRDLRNYAPPHDMTKWNIYFVRKR